MYQVIFQNKALFRLLIEFEISALHDKSIMQKANKKETIHYSPKIKGSNGKATIEARINIVPMIIDQRQL